MSVSEDLFTGKLRFLFKPARYKILWGGRGGAKSWGIARTLLAMAWKRPLRIMCAREIQKSLQDSVYQLLKDQIVALDLEYFYEIQESRIVGRNGSLFIFSGLRHNPASLKSVEGCDIVWVEEAQVVSKDSWDILIPTIRKEGSEIWISLNPRLDSDETWKRFVLNPPKGAVVVNVNYRDNPWFPRVLELERLEKLEKDPKGYLNVWEGQTQSSVDGAIYAAELAEATKEGRIGNVPRDRTKPVDTFWDLGFDDCTAIWFGQAMPDGTVRIVDYLESSGHPIEWYLVQLQQKGYLYGTDWVPHDAVDAIIHKKLTADPTKSIDMLMRAAGRRVRIAPKLHVATGINLVRTIFSTCWFDQTRCDQGIQALRHYQYAPNTGTAGTPDPREGRTTGAGVIARAPLHNWASHGSDAFRTLAFGVNVPKTAPVAAPAAPTGTSEYSWMG